MEHELRRKAPGEQLAQMIRRSLFAFQMLRVEFFPTLDNITALISFGTVSELDNVDPAYPALWSGFLLYELDVRRNSQISHKIFTEILSYTFNSEERIAKIAWMARTIWCSTIIDSGRRDLLLQLFLVGVKNKEQKELIMHKLRDDPYMTEVVKPGLLDIVNAMATGKELLERRAQDMGYLNG